MNKQPEIPSSRWYDAISKRGARRHFNKNRPIEPELVSALENICAQFIPYEGARAIFVNKPADSLFKGIIGGIGKIKNPPAFIAFTGIQEAGSIDEKSGYTGEGIILEATALGLNTCWVAGTYYPEKAAKFLDLKENEKLYAISPVGYAVNEKSFEEKLMSGFGTTKKRHSPSRLGVTNWEELPEWVRGSLEAARHAPSAINRQPWGFSADETSIMVYVRTRGGDHGFSKRFDCGIAMLHVEIAALHFGIKGEWEFLSDPQVARFHRVG